MEWAPWCNPCSKCLRTAFPFLGLWISCCNWYYFSLVILPMQNTKYFLKLCFLCSKLRHINEILFEKCSSLSEELLLKVKKCIHKYHLLCKRFLLFLQFHTCLFLHVITRTPKISAITVRASITSLAKKFNYLRQFLYFFL